MIRVELVSVNPGAVDVFKLKVTLALAVDETNTIINKLVNMFCIDSSFASF
jgi:hypothetical protein